MNISYFYELKTTKGTSISSVFFVDRILERIEKIEIYGDFDMTEELVVENFVIPDKVFDSRIESTPTNIRCLGSDENRTGIIIYDKSSRKEVSHRYLKLENIIINDGIKTIKPYFLSNINMDNVILPKSLEKLSDGCFSNSTIKSIALNTNLRHIFTRVFQYCNNLKEIVIPENVEFIYGLAFDGSGLEKITFEGNKISLIGNGCFTNCRLKTFDWPENCNTIGKETFYGCSELSEIRISPHCRIDDVNEDAFVGTNIETLDLSKTFAIQRPRFIKHIYKNAEKEKKIKIIEPFYC